MSPTKKPLKRPVAEATIAESVMEEEGANQDYRDKRARNNLAVKKSREKNKQKINQTHERVSQLKEENQTLESNIKLLSKELKFLKEVFVAHAGQEPFSSMIADFLSITGMKSLPQGPPSEVGSVSSCAQLLWGTPRRRPAD